MLRRSTDRVDLPSVPAVLVRIIELTNSQEADPEKLADVVLLDQSLSARVIRLANSAYFFRREKAETVTDAILTLGFGYVRNLAASASILDALFPQHSYPGLSWLNLWTHCVTCAVASESFYTSITGATRKNDESAFVAGLLHDIGKLVLAQTYKKKFIEVMELCCEREMEMVDAEYYCLATDHTRAGCTLLENWYFPPKLIAGVEFHHNPERAPHDEEVAIAVCAGNMLAKRLSEPYVAGANTNIPLQDISRISGLGMQDMGLIINDVRDGVLRCSEILCWGLDLPNWRRNAA